MAFQFVFTSVSKLTFHIRHPHKKPFELPVHVNRRADRRKIRIHRWHYLSPSVLCPPPPSPLLWSHTQLLGAWRALYICTMINRLSFIVKWQTPNSNSVKSIPIHFVFTKRTCCHSHKIEKNAKLGKYQFAILEHLFFFFSFSFSFIRAEKKKTRRNYKFQK